MTHGEITRAILVLRGHRVLLDSELATHDDATAAMLSAIRQLMHPPPPKRRGISKSPENSS